MNKSNKFSAEVRERAVRMVQEHRGSIPHSGQRSNPSPQRSTVRARRCRDGSSAKKLIAVSVRASPRRNVSASRHWSERLRNCAVPMRSWSWRAHFSRRWNSTAARSPEGLYRSASRPLRGQSICKVLRIAPSCYRRHAAQLRDPSRRCARAKRDEFLSPEIKRVWQANMRVYGADKVWKQLNRGGYCGDTLHRRAADEAAGFARCEAWKARRLTRMLRSRLGAAGRSRLTPIAQPCPATQCLLP
ncbi:hypothetical protein SAMN05192563_104354 [Paraburkholderia aspalathi]|uniref:Transposase n=1 Tax=Paraburkholderia aspalathi TaxID=1324617 RepID=A0A1I7EPR8_9BURK|nr:hypothetical protein SAMN05192563_104354 [Paraburkholderia aspalathi]